MSPEFVSPEFGAYVSQRPNVSGGAGGLGQGWYSAANSHGPKTTSYQYDLGTSGYSVKVYFNDGKNGGRDTAGIVSTNSIAHAMDAAAVILGAVDNDLMNFNLGVGYLREVGLCK